jgi:hypothetical protein
MILGVAWCSAADTIEAGNAVMYSDTLGVVAQASNGDTEQIGIGYVGTALDFAAAATTRTTRVFVNLLGKASDSANSHW